MNTTNMTYEALKNEITRAYRVLGKIQGEIQSYFDIDAWERLGAITGEQADELRRYSEECAKTL